jgi:hypothetical protein
MYGLLCICVIGYLCMLILIGWVFGAGAFWALLVASAMVGFLLGLGGFIGEFFFFRLRAGHIALLTEIITEGRFPSGISQMKWARGRVLHYFDGAGLLAEARQTLRKTLRAVNGHLFDSSAVLPVPGIEGGMKFAQRAVDASQGYVEESIVAYAFKVRNTNVFESIKTAVVLYCQCWKTTLGNSVMLTLMSYGFALVAAVIFLVPLGLIALQLNTGAEGQQYTILRFVLFAMGIFLGFAAKWAIFDPVACAATTLSFLEEAELLAPSPIWEEKIESVTQEFKDLRQKAREFSEKNAPLSPFPFEKQA